MNQCHHCGNELQAGQFCQICGAQRLPLPQQAPLQAWAMPPHNGPTGTPITSLPPVAYPTGGLSGGGAPPVLPDTFYGRMVRGLAGMFDLHEKIASATILVDVMVFGGTVMTAGLGWPVLAMAALGLMFVTFTGQMNWHKDDAMSAATKAVLVGVLTAIPVPIAASLAVLMGLRRGKK